jgi:protein SCO1/2
LSFENTRGQEVKLRDFFDGKHPVILTLNYSNCPMLCNLQLEGLFAGLKDMEWQLGDKFQMVSVSIDPTETKTRALQTKQKYLKQYGRSSAEQGLHFLVGKQQAIRALADSVGFRYKYIREKNEYAHAAAAIILTPEGKVSRYLYDVEFDPQTLKLALLEATEGKIGTTMDQVLLFCYRYDAASGSYAPAAVRIMQVGAVFVVLVLGTVLLVYWLRESRKGRSAAAQARASQTPA